MLFRNYLILFFSFLKGYSQRLKVLILILPQILFNRSILNFAIQIPCLTIIFVSSKNTDRRFTDFLGIMISIWTKTRSLCILLKFGCLLTKRLRWVFRYSWIFLDQFLIWTYWCIAMWLLQSERLIAQAMAAINYWISWINFTDLAWKIYFHLVNLIQ